MEPVQFNQANSVLTKPEGMTDEECGPLPTYSNGEYCLSCWRPTTFKEWFSFLFYRKIWIYVHSGHTQPPIVISLDKTVFDSPHRKSAVARGIC